MPSQNLPTFDQRQSMWSSVRFARRNGPFPAIAAFVKELQPLYANGRVVHAAFEIPGHPILDWYLQRHQFHEVGFFEHFWKSEDVRLEFPDKLADLNFFDFKVFSHSSPFVLGGGMAWMLSQGGAYRSFDRGGFEAKRLGEDAAVEMLTGSYDDSLVYESGLAWSSFFFDVAWDHTYVAINRGRKTIHCLLATDTD